MQAELQDIDSYLAKMGVKDANLRRRLETALPYTDQAALGAGGSSAPAPVAPLNAAAREAAAAAAGGSSAWSADTPVLLVCCDAGGGFGGLEQLLAALELPVFAVRLPEGEVEDAPAELAELAMLGTKAMRGVVPAGARLVLAGAWRAVRWVGLGDTLLFAGLAWWGGLPGAGVDPPLPFVCHTTRCRRRLWRSAGP